MRVCARGGDGIIRERSGNAVIELSDQRLHFRSCQNKGTAEMRLNLVFLLSVAFIYRSLALNIYALI